MTAPSAPLRLYFFIAAWLFPKVPSKMLFMWARQFTGSLGSKVKYSLVGCVCRCALIMEWLFQEKCQTTVDLLSLSMKVTKDYLLSQLSYVYNISHIWLLLLILLYRSIYGHFGMMINTAVVSFQIILHHKKWLFLVWHRKHHVLPVEKRKQVHTCEWSGMLRDTSRTGRLWKSAS